MNETASEPLTDVKEWYTNYLREKLEKREAEVGPNQLDIAECLLPLAVDLISRGDETGAEALLLRALFIRETLLGIAHPQTAEVLEKLSTCHRRQGHFAQAEAGLGRALGIRSLEGTATWEYAPTLELSALLESAKGSFDQAQLVYLDAIAIAEKVFGPDSWGLVETLWHFGMMLETQKRYEKTLEISNRIRQFAMNSTKDDEGALDFLAMRARALNLLGRHEEWRDAVNEIKSLMHESKSGFECSESWLTGYDAAAVVAVRSDQ